MRAPRPRRPRTTVAPHLALALLLPACIPWPRHYPLTPVASGVYRGADGAPLAGAQLRLSARRDDATCRHPAATAVTDSLGRFTLAATSRAERVLWLIPVDPAPRPPFFLCATDGSGSATIPFAEATVAARRSSGDGGAPAADMPACLVARSRDGRTIACP